MNFAKTSPLFRKMFGFLESKTPLGKEIATRDRAALYTIAGWLPNPDRVLKKIGKDIEVYRDLVTDGHVRGCIKSRKAGVLSLQYGLDRGKARSRVAGIVGDVFQNLNMPRIVSEMLEACQFGYAPMEIIWEHTGGLWLPANVVGKPPEWFCFGEHNELRLKTKDNYIYGEPVPAFKFIVPTQDATYDNPYGFADMSACFWPATFKKAGMKFWLTFAEKYGQPFAIGKHPRGASKEETRELLDMLESMVQDAVASIPDDNSVELVEAAGKSASAELYRELLQWCKSEISTVQLGHEGAAQSTPGKLGNDTTALTVRDDIVNADKKIVEQAINQLIRWICELNFDGAEAPEWSMWREDDVDKTLAERDLILSQVGVSFNEKYIERAYGIPQEQFTMKPPVSAQFPAAFAERLSAKTKPDGLDAMSKRLEDEASLDELFAPVEKLMSEATDINDLRNRIIELYPDMDIKPLGAIIEKALVAADCGGRLAAGK
jgi:phage gp29-like protein